jgi:hypothetical protein
MLTFFLCLSLGAGGGGTYEGYYFIATEHFIHIPFVISEAYYR